MSGRRPSKTWRSVLLLQRTASGAFKGTVQCRTFGLRNWYFSGPGAGTDIVLSRLCPLPFSWRLPVTDGRQHFFFSGGTMFSSRAGVDPALAPALIRSCPGAAVRTENTLFLSWCIRGCDTGLVFELLTRSGGRLWLCLGV